MSPEPPTYMPLFRGKEFELRLLDLILPSIQGYPIVPIIEPVSANTAQLERVIDFYATFQVPVGVVINPVVGAFRKSPQHLVVRVKDHLRRNSAAFPVCRVRPGNIEWDLLEHADKFALIEDGALCGETMAELLSAPARLIYRIIPHENANAEDGRLPGARILLADGFPRRPNAEYPPDEEFRSGPGRLDLQYAAGWADYSTAGAKYQESGAKPYAVAIHITYWEPDEGALRVRHYISDRTDGPEDTEGKFGEALEKLMADLDAGSHPILETSAIREFRALHAIEHCPGLGMVKLRSMQHHLETVCEYLRGIR